MNGTHLALIGLCAGIIGLPMINFKTLLARLDLWYCRAALRQMSIRHPDWLYVRRRVMDLELQLMRGGNHDIRKTTET